MNNIENLKSIEGPILVIGASGFVGANLFNLIKDHRDDVFGTSFSGSGWRHKNSSSIIHMNICDIENVKDVYERVKPKTIFDCSSFGAYSFEDNSDLIHKTNFMGLIDFLEFLKRNPYLHIFMRAAHLNTASILSNPWKIQS